MHMTLGILISKLQYTHHMLLDKSLRQLGITDVSDIMSQQQRDLTNWYVNDPYVRHDPYGYPRFLPFAVM